MKSIVIVFFVIILLIAIFGIIDIFKQLNKLD